jgi:murein DD-endopeptidase MepM/ murein hydrolase activator NlpD
MKKSLVLLLFFFSISLYSQEIKFYGEAQQGNIIIGEGKNIKSVLLNNQKLLVSKSGMFVFGFDRDAKGNQKLKVTFKNKKSKTFEYKIEKREYETQKLHVASKYVTPPKRELKRIKKEIAAMKTARKKMMNFSQALYSAGFAYPVDSVEITGIFGSQRILNGKPRNVHNGMDFGAEEGDTIRAISDGIVRIAGDNFFYNGNFVLLDHGQGLSSVYLHMSKILTKTGEKIKKGESIGLVGSTGRATGPHLHLGVQWYNKRIDPMCLFNMKFPD